MLYAVRSLGLCRNVPYRLRVRLARKRNEDEDAENKMYTLVTHVEMSLMAMHNKGPLIVENE